MAFYRDYDQWRRGEGRWPLLEASFKGDLPHDAIGKPAVCPDNALRDSLTDGRLACEDSGNPSWTSFSDGDMECVIDMGESVPLNTVAARFLQYRPAGISLPDDLIVLLSDDGTDFKAVSSSPMEKSANDLHDAWIDLARCTLNGQKARYVKVIATRRDGIIMWDELLSNPKY